MHLSEIKKTYLSGKSINETANLLNISRHTVYKTIKELNICRTRNDGLSLARTKISNSNRKFNEFSFDDINNISAYFLGLLFADGCVSKHKEKDKYMVSFTSKDKELVLRLKSFLVSENQENKEEVNGRIYYRISFCSKHLTRRLISLGCDYNKSNKLEKPKIERKYVLPFLMGFFDGDGSISLNRTVNSWKCSLGTGSFYFFKWLCEFLEDSKAIFSTEKRKTKSGKDFYNISLCGISAKFFLTKIYDSVCKNFTLQRKRKLYDLMCTKKFKGPKFQLWEKEIMRQKISNNECSVLIESNEKNFGWKRSPDTIRHWRKENAIK